MGGVFDRKTHRSIELDPRRSIAWWDLALVLAKKGDDENSVACLLISREFSPDQSVENLRSLLTDDDLLIRSAGGAALARIFGEHGADAPKEMDKTQ